MHRITLFLLLQFVASILWSQCPEDIIFFSQSDVDQFAVDYPDCTEISQSLVLFGDDIVDLSPLSDVVSIGDLAIIECSSLETLDDLTSITHIGNLDIEGNAILRDISALTNISDTLHDILIVDNAAIEQVNGFENVISIESFRIDNNLQLREIIGWNSLTTCNSTLYINYNSSLDRIEGFNALVNNKSFELLGNNYCDVIGFENAGRRNSFRADQIDSLIGFNNADGNGFRVNISGVNYIDAFNNFDTLGALLIRDMPSTGGLQIAKQAKVIDDITFINLEVEEFNIFSKLEKTGETVAFNSCNIHNLDFLSTVTEVMPINEIAVVGLYECPNLTDISGIQNIKADSISLLRIARNPLLEVCNNDFVCDVLNIGTAIIIIEDNLPGCNSVEEILAACPEDEAEDPMDLCPFMAPRPGMQINRMSEVEYEILYTFMDKEMYIRNISYTEVLDMIEHHKISKDVFFDAERFSFDTYCEQAEGIAHRTQNYEYTIPQEPLMEMKAEQAISEIDYFRNFAWQIQPGECVKL